MGPEATPPESKAMAVKILGTRKHSAERKRIARHQETTAEERPSARVPWKAPKIRDMPMERPAIIIFCGDGAAGDLLHLLVQHQHSRLSLDDDNSR